jgi:general stress protein 26
MEEALRSKILEVLRRHHTMTLATIRPDGYPQATTVNYIHDDLTLYFATDATSQKAGNIKLNNKVSVAIASEAQDFYKLRGLSMSGIATRVDEKQRAEELSLRLFQAFPQSKRYVPEDPNQLSVYEITPVGHGTGRLHFGLRQDLLGRAISDFAKPRDLTRASDPHRTVLVLGFFDCMVHCSCAQSPLWVDTVEELAYEGALPSSCS